MGTRFEPEQLKSISVAEQRELQDPKEIVVTWSFLLKASIGIAAGLGVIVVAMWGIISLKGRVPSAPGLSPLKIESVQGK